MATKVKINEYYRRFEAGEFEGRRVELVEGAICEMRSPTPARATAICHLGAIFHRAFEGRATVNTRLPLTLSLLNEPEPDISLVRRAPDDYSCRHPNGGETLLVVEVSDGTPDLNRSAKADVYCASVNEYWILDVSKRQLEVFRLGFKDEENSGSWSWKFRFVIPADGRINTMWAPDVEFAVADLLPRAPDETIAVTP